jgi:hypothetical protein
MRVGAISSILLVSYAISLSATCIAQQSTPQVASPPATAITQADQQLCAVSGTIISAATGEPLRKAEVTMHQRNAGPDKDVSALSDSAGRFSFETLPPGRYDLSVSHVGYVATSYGARDPASPGAVLSLMPGQKITELIFRLYRTISIVGRLLDQDGDPIQNAEVTLALRRTLHGKIQIDPQQTALTDDRGEYRVWGISPGKYVLVASPAPMKRVTRKNQPDRVYVQSYYPDTTDSARAEVLDVKAGDQLTGMDFTMTPRASTQTFKIRGHVSTTIEVDHESTIGLMLLPRGNPMMQFQDRPASFADKKTGDFEIDHVAPGDYVLTAFQQVCSESFQNSQNLTIASSDLDHLTVAITRGADIVARLLLQGKKATSTYGLSVILEPFDDVPGPAFQTQTAERQRDGTFLWKGIADGNYLLWIFSDCSDCYLQKLLS